MHRLFVGLRPPPAIRAQLSEVMDGVPGARWQSDEQLHITLRFIGEVDRWQGEDVAAALAALHAPAVEVALAGVGAFDKRGRINALWVGLAPHAPLAALHRKVDQAIIRAGLAPEGRAYLPHITIARLGSGAGPVERFLADHAALASPAFRLEHVTLFESHLGHGGASYEPIERYRLGS